MRKVSTNPATIDTLETIQEQMREMCRPHYDEFHRVTTERGFTKITLPSKTARRA